MASAEAQICNKALARLGIKKYIGALDEQTEEAETCGVFYTDTRDACLAAFPWPFATLRQTLAQVAPEQEPVRDGWAYVYALPADCLAPRRIWSSQTQPDFTDLYPQAGTGALTNGTLRKLFAAQKIPFAVEKASQGDGRVILCDAPAATLFYTAQVADPAKFPALFLDALAWLLAAEMAMALTGKERREMVARERYRTKISEARATMWNEQQEDEPPETETIAGRL